MNNKIKNILIKRHGQNKLASLYLISPFQNDLAGHCFKWSISLLSEMLQVQNLENQLDLFFLKDDKKKSYKVEDLTPLYQFLNFEATQLNRKYIIIDDASKLSTILFNKLLKVLEEPPVETTVFLLNPQKIKILETIQSRAIKISLQFKNDLANNKMQDLFHQPLNFLKFEQLMKEKKMTNKRMLSLILDSISTSNLNHLDLKSIKNQIIDIENDFLFHNSDNAIKKKLHNLSELVSFKSREHA